MRKFIRYFLICLIAAVSSGCSSQNTAVSDVVTPSPTPVETFSPPVPTSTPAPQAGGLLNISIREPKTFNPLVNDDVTVDLMLGLVFEPLIVFDEQMKPEPNGRIISDITVNTAVPTAQITIKANAVWADGSPITATDIVYSLDTIKNAENSLYKSCVNYIAGYSSSGNKTVTINFTETYASVLYKLNFPIIPANFSEETPVGSGLYKITEYTPRKGVRLKTSENANSPPPYITELYAHIAPDYESDYASFISGIIDVLPRDFSDGGKYTGKRHATTVSYDTNYFDFVGFNMKDTLFSKQEARFAVAQLIPYDEIVSKAYAGFAEKSQTFINPNSWLAVSEEDELTIDFDAKEYLQGKRFEILVNSENKERVKTAEILMDTLNSYGAKCSVAILPFVQYEKRLKNGDFDVFIGGVNFAPDLDMSFLLHSNSAYNFVLDKGENYFGYSNEVTDSLIESMRRVPNETALKTTARLLQENVSKDLPFIGIAFRKDALILNENIFGVETPSYGNIYLNIDKWYIVG